MQIDGQGAHLWSILRGSLYSFRKASPAHLLTRWATHFLHLVLSHQQAHLRQVMHLSAFPELPSDALQGLLAVRADQRAMSHHIIRAGHLHQGASSMSRLPSRLLLAPLMLAPWLSPWVITRRRFEARVAIFGQQSFYSLQPICQLGDLLVRLC